MYGFPASLISLICCPQDSSPLQLDPSTNRSGSQISNGLVHCESCSAQYRIQDGILNLLDVNGKPVELDTEMRHGQQLWNKDAADYDHRMVTERALFHTMEVRAMLAAFRGHQGQALLELGCGTGRLTTLLMQDWPAIVAVDFSLEQLRILASKIGSSKTVALVQADATRPVGIHRAFDGVISAQLVQALPSRDHRMALFRYTAEAVADGGRFVFTTYNHGVRNRLLGISRSARYVEGGIYRYYSPRPELRREIAPYFSRVRDRLIVVVVPFTSWLGLSPERLSALAEYVPLVSQLGRLLLVTAERPVRRPSEGGPSMAIEGARQLLQRRFRRSHKPAPPESFSGPQHQIERTDYASPYPRLR